MDGSHLKKLKLSDSSRCTRDTIRRCHFFYVSKSHKSKFSSATSSTFCDSCPLPTGNKAARWGKERRKRIQPRSFERDRDQTGSPTRELPASQPNDAHPICHDGDCRRCCIMPRRLGRRLCRVVLRPCDAPRCTHGMMPATCFHRLPTSLRLPPPPSHPCPHPRQSGPPL